MLEAWPLEEMGMGVGMLKREGDKHVSRFTNMHITHCRLGARRVAMMVNVQLRTRRALLPCNLYSGSALLVLN